MTPSARLTWVRMYEQTGNAGVTCRRCGVSRPTLRKWWRRYQTEGVAGFADHSRRPYRSPSRRVFATEEDFIVSLRKSRNSASSACGTSFAGYTASDSRWNTIHRALCRHGLNRLKRPKTGSQEVEALLTAASRRSGADGCLQNWCGPVSVHRYR